MLPFWDACGSRTRDWGHRGWPALPGELPQLPTGRAGQWDICAAQLSLGSHRDISGALRTALAEHTSLSIPSPTSSPLLLLTPGQAFTVMAVLKPRILPAIQVSGIVTCHGYNDTWNGQVGMGKINQSINAFVTAKRSCSCLQLHSDIK